MNHLIGFVTLGLSTLLLNLIPQVAGTLQDELQRPDQAKVPSLFMFDIQEEQVELLKEQAQEEGVAIDRISPMIRARLMKVNGALFDKGVGAASDQMSREEEREMRFRNRGFNLTYREKLSEFESLVAGRDFSGSYDPGGEALPEISVEKRFASRLDLEMGDVLEFDIESIPITGKIVNLRSVQWTSFQPNFFVQFQPGVLEMAPKTFIATVPRLDPDAKQSLQDRLVQKLPNVSMVDVSRVVQRIIGVVDQMLWALLLMSVLGVVAGFVVIYSIASHQAQQRRWDIGLLKALGASFSSVQSQFLWQYGLVGFAAIFFGSLISAVLSTVLTFFIFDQWGAVDWMVPLFTLVIGILITLWVTRTAISGALRTRVSDLLF